MHHGTNLLDLVRLAPELGVEVTNVRRTGELRFRHPALTTSVRVNGRRKDAPRALTAFFTAAQRCHTLARIRPQQA